MTFRVGTGQGPRREGEEGSRWAWQVYIIRPRRADTLKSESADPQALVGSLPTRKGGGGRHPPHKKSSEDSPGSVSGLIGVKMRGCVCPVALVLLGAAVCGEWAGRGSWIPQPAPGVSKLGICDLRLPDSELLPTARLWI